MLVSSGMTSLTLRLLLYINDIIAANAMLGPQITGVAARQNVSQYNFCEQTSKCAPNASKLPAGPANFTPTSLGDIQILATLGVTIRGIFPKIIAAQTLLSGSPSVGC